ncbi:MAG: DEAD/DEAH box helicase [Phycisphaerales bacterium JB038]
MRFEDLGLAEPIVRAVTAEGYERPTPIQNQAIPPVLAGQDVLGCAQTGTGKTGAFALPLLHRLAETSRKGKKHARRPRALVLCPTRELATQIFESFQTYGGRLPLRQTAIFGGVGQVPQVRQLNAGVDIVVATPGRLMDLMDQGCIDLSAIEALVLDEADRMLDRGFIGDIRKIAKHLPERRQTLLFSATMPPEIRRLAEALLTDPVFVQVAPVASTAEAIQQTVYHVDKRNKPILLERLLTRDDMERTLIFSRTKYGADRMVRGLRRAGIRAEAIHGDKSQGARTRALASFKSGRNSVLVATDIASRGIDVDEITHVINFDLPNEPETYVHRIGRTARAGASGVAISFCDREEQSYLRAIERLIDKKIAVVVTERDIAPAGGQSARPTGGVRKSGGGHKSDGHPSRRRKPRASNGGGGRGPRRARSSRARQGAK